MTESSEEEKKLFGGVAVITGAGSGIGAGIARRTAELGMTVIVVDINSINANETTRSIIEAGGKAEAKVVDVSKPAELDRLATEVFEKYHSVRLLVNNAGIETLGYTWEIPVTRWEATLNVNIHGVVHGVRAFVPAMIASGEECWIANLSSVGGFGMMPTQTAYIMTKHAVQSFSECLFIEMQVAEVPIHVSSVIPGMLKTAIFNPEAGVGEPDSATRYRTAMYGLMKEYGMDLDEGCRKIVEQIAANKFWVSTQPEMTANILADRISYFKDQSDPKLAEQAKQLLQH